MGSHERDVTPDKAMNDMLFNPSAYQGNYDKYSQDVLARRGQGLPQSIKDIYIKQGKGAIGGSLRAGQQRLREGLAGTGSPTPIDALMKGMGGLQSGANTAYAGLADTVAMRDYDAQNANLGLMGGLADMESRNYANRLGALAQNQQFGVQATQAHNADKFSWGKAVGMGSGLAGNFFGGQMSRKDGGAEAGGN